jgi:hypothetical protein
MNADLRSSAKSCGDNLPLPVSFGFLKHWSGFQKLVFVNVDHGPTRHAFADFEFVLGMNVARFTDIDSYYESGFRH